ncbi:dimethylaniline monooxygenase [Sporothrix brasiliensis 5110]|uniref:Dimethylaniline monooxygenase n=1 Tax=Sporothrix brasiliensis 5110 TaxID=1398154 RepID=A0A0C2IV20_9PEZI|nr:dimethylaniline monooxygenase [Sporothrix brasiliensis 5110]KIH88852.1 dimethylaniline monooxygenase [Sporothrix brasiliensis 5110]
MAPRYRRVAVIGAGPSGLAATHALASEKSFDTIRVFDRRDQVGGLWHYDAEPDTFPTTTGVPSDQTRKPPVSSSELPAFTPASAPDHYARSALYWDLDSNVGAESMAFTHTPFPVVNSPVSIERFGHNNPSRPYGVITNWIEDLFKPYLSLVTLRTTVEKVDKRGKEWVLTLRRSGLLYRGKPHDYWWTEAFDAVVVASGHYHVPFVPAIDNLIEVSKQLPGRFEHSKSYRKAAKYADKRVLVVGGNVSASDFIQDLHGIVSGKLEVAVRNKNPVLDAVYRLPNVRLHTTVKAVEASADGKVNVVFSDDHRIDGIDYVLFATGYRLQYPFLHPNPTTPENRVAGFYQHVFSIDDPSLTLIGQVKAGLSFRVYEYQAVAVARYYAGRNGIPLPTAEDQRAWETDRVARLGPTNAFHAIAPDFEVYFNWLVDFAGRPAPGTDGYALPRWDDKWAAQGLAILGLKDKYWRRLIAQDAAIKAKL